MQSWGDVSMVKLDMLKCETRILALQCLNNWQCACQVNYYSRFRERDRESQCMLDRELSHICKLRVKLRAPDSMSKVEEPLRLVPDTNFVSPHAHTYICNCPDTCKDLHTCPPDIKRRKTSKKKCEHFGCILLKFSSYTTLGGPCWIWYPPPPHFWKFTAIKLLWRNLWPLLRDKMKHEEDRKLYFFELRDNSATELKRNVSEFEFWF